MPTSVPSVRAAKQQIFDIKLDKLASSSLVDKSKKIQTDHKLSEIGKFIPSTYVPGRNTIFLSIALGYAESIDAEAIFIGVNAILERGCRECCR